MLFFKILFFKISRIMIDNKDLHKVVQVSLLALQVHACHILLVIMAVNRNIVFGLPAMAYHS